MGYIEGVPRDQTIRFPDTLDEYISGDNPVRFIDAYVDYLDLDAAGFGRTEPAETGRPAYQPGDLLKLYIYGYLQGIRSSRKLETESKRNVELMWLLGKLSPDHKTIADFRKDNRAAFKQVFRNFCLLCRKLELFGGELIAIDGSKFKAMNNKRKNFTQAKLTQALQQIEAKIEAYLADLEAGDRQDLPGLSSPSPQDVQAKIEVLKDKKATYKELIDQMEASGQTQISLTDPDSRSMPKSPKVDVGYNVQVAVDEKHKLIVAQEVTNAITDVDQLSGMALAAKKTLGVEHLKAVADMGYYHGDEIKTCEKQGIEPYVAKPLTSANTKLGLFGKQDFVYEPDADAYRCPGDQLLSFRFETVEKERQIRYYANPSACRCCPLKAKCTRNKAGRRITRWIDEALLEAMAKRVEANPEMMRKRKAIVEHPFGTIKHWGNQGYFLMRTLEKVRAEFSLTALTYNLKRVINILGVPKMIVALG